MSLKNEEDRSGMGRSRVFPGARNAAHNRYLNQFFKTEMCKYHVDGYCNKGDRCSHAHSPTELSHKPDLSKARMCKALLQHGVCEDVDCHYAHRIDTVQQANAFFRTKLCEFQLHGTCKLGNRCRYAHCDSELVSDEVQWDEVKNTYRRRKRRSNRRTLELPAPVVCTDDRRSLCGADSAGYSPASMVPASTTTCAGSSDGATPSSRSASGMSRGAYSSVRSFEGEAALPPVPPPNWAPPGQPKYAPAPGMSGPFLMPSPDGCSWMMCMPVVPVPCYYGAPQAFVQQDVQWQRSGSGCSVESGW